MIAGFFGMNVAVTLTGDHYVFWIVLAVSLGLSAFSMIFIYAKFMRGN
ncbi:MAG: hypothetical protein IKT36_04880 [Methanocorpusculum sp.]|nr:hypothetical protein [Methanocorpusculum sp.]MBR5450074.1 hypothetical protein [Methanocorpusculum sp.]